MLLNRIFFGVIFLFLFSISCNSNDDSSMDIDNNPELSVLQTIAAETPNQITWVAKETMKSRNGNSLGYGVILNPNSDKLFIFLDGGGACYNAITCSNNIDSYSEDDFLNEVASSEALIFNRTALDNQFKDWNIVFVPYATGDVHSGSNTSANVPFNGPTNQVMTGYNNIGIVLNDLKTYFNISTNPVNEIVFSGSSAGGFGVFMNIIQLATIFGTEIQTTALVDSGQLFLGTNILTTCLEEQWNSLWQLDHILPLDIDTVVTNTYDFNIQKIYDYVALKYPNFNFGFISTYEDLVIRGFYSFGQNNCPQIPIQLLEGSTFKTGLLNLKTNVLDNHNNWKVFLKNGDDHTFLGSSTLNETINNTTLNQWISNLRQGLAADLAD